MENERHWIKSFGHLCLWPGWPLLWDQAPPGNGSIGLHCTSSKSQRNRPTSGQYCRSLLCPSQAPRRSSSRAKSRGSAQAPLGPTQLIVSWHGLCLRLIVGLNVLHVAGLSRPGGSVPRNGARACLLYADALRNQDRDGLDNTASRTDVSDYLCCKIVL